MKNVVDILHCIWWLGWRTVAAMAAVVGFMYVVALINEVIL